MHEKEYYFTVYDSGNDTMESHGPFATRKEAWDAMWKHAQKAESEAPEGRMDVDEEGGYIRMSLPSIVDDYDVITWSLL